MDSRGSVCYLASWGSSSLRLQHEAVARSRDMRSLECQLLASLRNLWEEEATGEEAFPLLAAAPGSQEGRGSRLGSSPRQWEPAAVSSPRRDPHGILAALCNRGFPKAAHHSHHGARLLSPPGEQAAGAIWARASSQKTSPKEPRLS